MLVCVKFYFDRLKEYYDVPIRICSVGKYYVGLILFVELFQRNEAFSDLNFYAVVIYATYILEVVVSLKNCSLVYTL